MSVHAQQAFESHLRHERRMSPRTVAAYLREVSELARFTSGQEWSQLTSQHLRQFVSDCHRRGQSGRTIQRTLSAIRVFFRFLLREGIVSSDPTLGIPAPKAAKHLPQTLSVDEVARLLAGNNSDPGPWHKRDLAMFELLYSSGLRLSELTGVNLDDLDRKEGAVRVIGKGAKTRIIPVGRTALEAIAAWLPERAHWATKDEKALFVSRKGTRISGRAVQSRMSEWVKKAGTDRHLHPHMLRHSFASHVLESSGDLRAVQELLGHANIGTTQVYTHLNFQHLADIYDKTHPRARKKKKSDL